MECIFGELLQGVKKSSETEILLSFWKYLPKVYCEDIIIEAGVYSTKNKLLDNGVGLIDAVILVHGLITNSRIWTLDTKFLRILPEELIFIE